MNHEKKLPLTDVQFAYMSGRNSNLHLGGISTHFYAEFDSLLIPEKFEVALNRVIGRQEMLRAYICEDGMQHIMDEAPHFPVECIDLRGMPQDEAQAVLDEYREKISNRIFPLGQWPMFEFRFFQLTDDHYRLVTDFDMMIVDGMSTELIIQEILYCYDTDSAKPALPYAFSDFIESQSEKREQKEQEDKAFWDERIDRFTTGPFLEKRDKDAPDVPHFDTMEQIIPAESWGPISERLRKQHILPTMFLLTAYAKTVSAWTNTPKLTIDMTASDRKGAMGQNYQEVLGDFTKILPVDFEFTGQDDLIALSKQTQKKISAYKKHLNGNILSFVREVTVREQTEGQAAFPFVFTGMLFDLAKSGWKEFGDRVYQISQTPQVLLDNQITLKNGALTVHWDYPEQYWERERLEKMQQYFLDTVLTGTSEVLNQEADKFLRVYNDTAVPYDYESALEKFERQAEEYPDNTAVLTDTSEVTYEELERMANCEAHYLLEKYGEKKGFLVEGERNFRTIVHMLAVLKTGGYYVPIATHLPEKRKQYILEKSDSVAILTDDTYWDADCDNYSEDRITGIAHPAEDLMYVIYTSGTTGTPKGVAITNQALVNTVIDINDRFGVTEDDQIIGISSFGFDLSVYDVFGALAVGASVLLHDKQENVFGMIDKLKNYPVTVWNTVPALMQLVVDELDETYQNTTLRLVMMSGDWIPVNLPAKIHQKFPNAAIYSLGGATEAAIWSIHYPIKAVDPSWSSIPYGYPLANQSMYILGFDRMPLPYGIEGDIYIGGEGVAVGYQNEPEKTAAAFIQHPTLGRLYRTGDRGYFSPEGYMVFCGRKDTQVKIHGNRIELGEIESCIRKQENVANAVANVVDGSGGTKKLFAYYVPKDTHPYDAAWIEETVQKQDPAMEVASEQLPDYITVEEYRDISDSLEQVSISIINNAFYYLNFFTEQDEVYSLEELFSKGEITAKYDKLVYQWADSLAKTGAIKKLGTGIFQTVTPVHEINIDAMYEAVMQKKGASYWGGSFEFLTLCNKNMLQILKADVNPLTILFPEGEMKRAENIYRYNPIAEYMNNLAAEAVEQYIKNRKDDRTVRILEFGAGTGGTTAAILERIKDYNVEYTFTDLSTFFTDSARERFADYDFVNYRLFNIDEKPQSQGYKPASFDIILGANVLHDAKVIRETLKNFRYLLSNEGMLAALEVTTNKIYHKVSIGFIEGFSGYSDERLEKNEPLLSAPEWKKAMEDCGFISVSAYPEASKPAEVYEQHVILGYAAHNKAYCDEETMVEALREDLPNYMIPEKIYALYELPLSANSKVNHKALPYEQKDFETVSRAIVPPQTETEKILHEIIRETLGLDELSTDVNIFTIGADSLKSISVLTKLKNRGIEVSLSNMYKYSTIQEMGKYIDSMSQSAPEEGRERVEVENFKPDLEHRYDPFPLSDLQESYYIGANETEGFNSIPTAGYVEIECQDYDADKLFHIINRLMERHDMLRAYIDSDGIQHVMREIPDFEIPVTDIHDWPEAEKEAYLAQVRKNMIATRIDLSKAPLFRCQITRIHENNALLHIYADGQIMDGWSFQLFFIELGTLYKDPDMKLEPLKATFRDYIRYKDALKETDKYKEDRDFWLERIPNIPKAGLLPLEKDIAELEEVEGIQVECGIPIEQWRQIEKKAQEHGVSAFSVLLTSFALSVARWNDKKRFLLNIPEFYRPPFSEDIFHLLGECASFLLFTMEDEPGDTFHEKVVKTQQQIMELKDHNSFSGMEITREIYKHNNGYNEVLAPIVFGMLPDAPEFEDTFIDIEKNVMKIKYQENHTSQIWIDVNTCVYSERIEFNYNSLKGLIDPAVLENLAAMQKSILSKAAGSEEFWNSQVTIPLPERDAKVIRQANATKMDLPVAPLPELLARAFAQFPDRPYLRMKDRSYTYADMKGYVMTLAAALEKQGIHAGDKVAVHMGKSLGQITAALTLAYMGAVYTPIEFQYPKGLVCKALDWIHCDTLLTSGETVAEFADTGLNVIDVDAVIAEASQAEVAPAQVAMKDLVAIIHTSGTTGRPKAVMLRQESLVNALVYTNQHFEVTESDTAAGVTNPSHDMSLYDIFGMAIAGGSMILPEEHYAKDPEYWIGLMKQYPVTVWNSVPAMKEMLMEAAREEDNDALRNIRVILLGGDYVKPSLLQRIKRVNPAVKLYSGGGPTETTLWNILHLVEDCDLEEEVIPYGKPIANNTYYILNENLQQLPIGVTGTLYCGGIGVSDGYCEDAKQTNQRFVTLPQTGERIYNTGDRGHYRADGTILFDGREDQQVKINGKRIELSAIASVAEENANAGQAAAVKAGENQLVLFYTGELDRDRLGDLLPDYMVPRKFMQVEKIPVTVNAKVDRAALLKLYSDQMKMKKKETQPATESGDQLEAILKERFCELLDLTPDEVDLDSDFFVMGGNSLIAMKLLSQLRETFDADISLTDLFTTATIREMKELLLDKHAVLRT